MEEWKEYKLEEISYLSTGFPFKGNKYSKDGIRVVRGDNVTIGQLRWDIEKDKRWNEYFEREAEFSLRANDIVIGMDGSRVGLNRAQIKKSDLPLLLAQRVACVRSNDKSIQKFLYYHIFSKRFVDYVKSIHTGTSIPHISLKQIGSFTIQLPPLEIQQKIANILSSLDDKIEVNRRINEQLEELAQTLFKSWFVDFEPFKDGEFVESELGMIPEGWKVGTLREYCKVKSGFAFKSSWWQDNGLKVIKIKNITSNGVLDMSDCSYVAPENTLKAKDFKTNIGDLLIAMTGATIGKFCMISSEESMYVNQRVGKFFLGNNPIIKLPFIYCSLKTDRIYSEIVNKGQGSAQPNISGSDIENIRIPLPMNMDFISLFNDNLKGIFEKMIHNQQEITHLTNLRDTLLPKLMSGEIDVNEVEI